MIYSLYSVAVRDSTGNVERSYDIKEPTFGQENLEKIPKSFLAYATPGTVVSV